MPLSKSEVEKIAQLARLGLSEEEKAKYAKQLSSILEYVKQLQEVDTKNVLPTAQVTGLENVMREDIITSGDEVTQDRLMKNAPEVEDNLIKTKSVF